MLLVGVVGLGSSIGWARVIYRFEAERSRDALTRQADVLAFGSQQYIERATQFIATFQILSELPERLAGDPLADLVARRLVRAPVGLETGWFALSETSTQTLHCQPVQPHNLVSSQSFPLLFSLQAPWPNSPEVRQVLGHCLTLPSSLIPEATGRVLAHAGSSSEGRSGLWFYQAVVSDDRPVGLVVARYPLVDFLRFVFRDLHRPAIQVYLFDLPRDQLESSLSKANLDPTDQWLIGYDGVTLEPIQTLDVPRLRQEQGERKWAEQIRSLTFADRELSLLIVPQTSGLSRWSSSAWACTLGVLLTSILCAYLKTKIDRAQVMERLTQDLQMAHAATKISKAKAQQKAKELEQALLQLEQAQSQLVQNEKMTSLGQMAAGIAHEINNPVNFIHGNLEMLADYVQSFVTLIEAYDRQIDPKPPAIEEMIADFDLSFLKLDSSAIMDSMRLGTRRIRDIVRSMQLFSRMGSREFVHTVLAENIRSTLTILRPRLKSIKLDRPISIEEHYADLPPVYCCPSELNQVFLNLASNALDAIEERFACDRAPENDEVPHLHISTRSEPGGVCIVFSDNGIGLKPDTDHRIFDPFFTTKSVGKGTGLGLSISYRIVVKHHGGRLQCSPNPTGGTCFEIYLPTLHPHDLRLASSDSDWMGSTPPPSSDRGQRSDRPVAHEPRSPREHSDATSPV